MCIFKDCLKQVLSEVSMFFNRIAFLEFKNTGIAKKVQKQKQGVTIQKRVLILNRVGEKSVCRVTKADVENKRKKGK